MVAHRLKQADEEAARAEAELKAAERNALRCGRCKTVPEDWLDGDGFPLDAPPMRAEMTECRGCIELLTAQAKVRAEEKVDDDDPMSWWQIRFVPVVASQPDVE